MMVEQEIAPGTGTAYEEAAERGYFGPYGGQFVPETLMPALRELEQAFAAARQDSAFTANLTALARDFVGRPTPLQFAARLTERVGGARIYLKREDLAHTGAHKINNALGQGLLAQHMGKRRIIAETGAGQHGVAAATVCAMLGIEWHRLHGGGGRTTTGPECLAYEVAGYRGTSGAFGHGHPQRFNQ